MLQAVRRSDVVINLVGKQELTRNFDFFGSNVEAVSNIAKVKLASLSFPFPPACSFRLGRD